MKNKKNVRKRVVKEAHFPLSFFHSSSQAKTHASFYSKRPLNCFCTENEEKSVKPFSYNAFFCFWSRDLGRGPMTS